MQRFNQSCASKLPLWPGRMEVRKGLNILILCKEDVLTKGSTTNIRRGQTPERG